MIHRQMRRVCPIHAAPAPDRSPDQGRAMRRPKPTRREPRSASLTGATAVRI